MRKRAPFCRFWFMVDAGPANTSCLYAWLLLTVIRPLPRWPKRRLLRRCAGARSWAWSWDVALGAGNTAVAGGRQQSAVRAVQPEPFHLSDVVSVRLNERAPLGVVRPVVVAVHGNHQSGLLVAGAGSGEQVLKELALVG